MQIPPNAKRVFEIVFLPHVISKDPNILAADLKIAKFTKEVLYVLGCVFALGLTYSIAASYFVPSVVFGVCFVITLIAWQRFNSFVKKSETLQNQQIYRYDYLYEEKEWITLKFNDGTLKVARYLMRSLIRDRLIDSKEHVVNMSWKELMLKVRRQIESSCENKGNLFLGHRGLSCFDVSERIVDSEILSEKLVLLKTLGTTEEDLYLREAIENSLFLPTCLIRDPDWRAKIQGVHLRSLNFDSALTNEALSELIDLSGKDFKKLSLNKTFVTEESLVKLTDLPLQNLSLNNVTDRGLKLIGKIPTLTNLNITLSSHTHFGTKELEKLPLKLLWFQTDHLSKGDFASFGKMTHLTRLILRKSVESKYEKELSELKKNKPNLIVHCIDL